MKNNIFKRLGAMLIVVSLIFSSASCTRDEPHPEDEIIEFTLTAEPQTLDPQIANDYASIMLIKNLFEGLVRENADGEIVSGAADSWESSADGLSYTFHLNGDTCWSNGESVTAGDFVFGITRALAPETRSENAPDLFLIKNAQSYAEGKADKSELGVRAADDLTLEIELEYPSNNLLHALTLPVAMPCSESFFNTSKGKYGKEPELLITNGPFRIRENYGWDHNKYIYIRRSEEYKAANRAVPLGVNFTIGSAPADPIAAIQSGSTDICELFGNQLSRAEENDLKVETTSNTLWGICFNTDIKAFKNTNLRVALFGALDRKKLLKDAPESCIKTSQLIADSVSFGGKPYRKEVGDFTLDRTQNSVQMFETAKEKLAENDITVNSSYTILCLDDETSSMIVTQMIASWNEITGSYFNKESLSRNELEERIKSGDYEIAVAPLNTAIDSPMEFLSSFRSDSANNYINLNYPEYDKLIDKAMSGASVDETISSLMESEKYLVKYGYLYPLYYESRYFACSPEISGAIIDAASNVIDFTKVTKLRED